MTISQQTILQVLLNHFEEHPAERFDSVQLGKVVDAAAGELVNPARVYAALTSLTFAKHITRETPTVSGRSYWQYRGGLNADKSRTD